MSESMMKYARDLYAQQRHNTRLRLFMMSFFIVLIGLLGLGFDIFFQAGYALRIFLLPFLLLMIISGFSSIRSNAAASLWGKKSALEDDDDDDGSYTGLKIRMILWAFAVLLFLPIFLNPHIIDALIPRSFDIPLVRYFPMGTVLATVVGLVCVATSLRWGPMSILTSIQAESIQNNENTAVLKHVVTEMSIAAGLPEPSVYIVDDPDPNAFAIGANTNESALVVTSGLLSSLTREELQGVIAHEMAHIKNHDTTLMTTITVLFGAVLLLSDWMKKGSILGIGSGIKIPGLGLFFRTLLFLGWLLTLLLAPFIANIVAMAIARNQEYYADAVAAELTRNPGALASALIKIDSAAEPTRSMQKSISHLCIVDPLGRQMNNKGGFWADLFATHPPIKKRVLFLHALAYDKQQ